MFLSNFKKILLTLVLIGLVLNSIKQPLAFVFAAGCAALLFAKPLKKWARNSRKSWHFLILGIFFGLLTEIAAILDNIQEPPLERILFDADPFKDLFFSFFFYGIFIACWYGLLHRWTFSLSQVFFLSGIFGIFTEQFNPSAGGPVIFLNAISDPFPGIPVALLVACVYGIFPALAYFLTEHTFNNRKTVSPKAFIAFIVVFFLQWAIYGNAILPLIKKVFT